MTRDHDLTATPTPLASPWSTCPLTWPRAALLHLLPGVGLLLFFLAAAPRLQAANLPAIWGLLVGILVVTVPVELGVVLWALRGRSQKLSWTTLGFRPPGRGDLLPLLLAALACLLAPGLVIWLEPLLRGSLRWLPDWFSAGTAELASFSPGIQTATLVLWLVSAVVVGPVVEEIYFRGWLLPRLRAPRWRACAASSTLFAVYHLWQPQAWLTVLVFALPLTALVAARRNLTLSAAVHIGVNLLGFLALLTGVLSR